MLQSYLDCKKGKGCLYQFYHQYVVKDYVPEPSAAMQLGIWFEYMCTGAMPRSNVVPEPVTLKNGNLSADYDRMLYHIDKFKEIVDNYNIKIKEIGKEIIVDRIKGILDIWCEIDGIPAIIDIKTSAQIGNKWDEFGWDDKNFSYSTHVLQPAIYKYLIYKSLGIYDAPFYYLVFSTKNTDILFWEVKYLDFDEMCSQVEDLANRLDEFIENSDESSYTPICDYKVCQKCEMNCFYRQEIPKIETKFLKLEL
jgi:hypothetical protein